MGLPAKIVHALPESVQQFLAKQYYPRVLRNFTETSWDYSPVIKTLVPAGGVVIDAGANIGYLSHLFSQWVGSEGAVHSFEPVPWTNDILRSNVRKLGLSNIEVHQLALSNEPGTARMQIPRYADGRENFYESKITTEDDQSLRSVEVELQTLDGLFFDQLPKVDFIKIDVEGHELNVIKGAAQLIARDHPPLLIEVADKLADEDSPAGELLRVLRELGYAPHMIEAGKSAPWDGERVCVDYLFLHA